MENERGGVLLLESIPALSGGFSAPSEDRVLEACHRWEFSLEQAGSQTRASAKRTIEGEQKRHLRTATGKSKSCRINGSGGCTIPSQVC